MEVVQKVQKNVSDLKKSIDIICMEQEFENVDQGSFTKNPQYFIDIQKSLQEIKTVIDSMSIYQSHNLLRNKLQEIETQWHDYQLSINKQYDEINNRLSAIEKEKRIPKKALLKKLLSPLITSKIGVLYHYHPKMMRIPKSYKKQKIMKTPLISIVTPSFNQGRFIEKTVTSVLYQKYPALEYIIQDGGSTDDTHIIIEKYKNLFKHCESKTDNGQTHAINLGFQHANGEIMGYLNSDDILLPGALAYIAEYFERHPEVDVVYGHRILIDEFGHEIGRWILPPHDNKVLSWADYIPQESLFWRKRVWDKIGGRLDENFRFAMDWDMILRFRDVGAKFVRLPRFLGGFRIHIHQKTSSEMSRTGIEEIERLRTRCHGRLVAHYEVAHHIRAYKIKHLIYHYLYKIGLLRY
jgi:glycosyltransferase involved in cell wall biosynthesis